LARLLTFPPLCPFDHEQVRSHNEFLLGMRVSKVLAGKSVQKSGLRQLPNAFLVAIDRDSKTLHAVSPDEVLEVDDILWFAGGCPACSPQCQPCLPACFQCVRDRMND
jgi:hypothetical protein